MRPTLLEHGQLFDKLSCNFKNIREYIAPMLPKKCITIIGNNMIICIGDSDSMFGNEEMLLAVIFTVITIIVMFLVFEFHFSI